MSKAGTAGAPDPAAASAATTASPPKQIMLAIGALILTVVAALAAIASLFGEKDWLLSQAITANNKLKAKDRKTQAELMHQVNITPGGQLLQTAVLSAALLFVAYSLYRGKFWSRWGVIGLWVLVSFTGMVTGFLTSVLGVASSAPIAFKAPSFVAGLAFVAAVILVSLRPSSEFLNRNRPVRPGRPAGRPGGLGGLLAPRPPVQPRSAASKIDTRTSEPATTTSLTKGPDRARSKARASNDAVAKGAELARNRAKASKSRRTAT